MLRLLECATCYGHGLPYLVKNINSMKLISSRFLNPTPSTCGYHSAISMTMKLNLHKLEKLSPSVANCTRSTSRWQIVHHWWHSNTTSHCISDMLMILKTDMHCLGGSGQVRSYLPQIFQKCFGLVKLVTYLRPHRETFISV